jgi:cell division protein FtsZ
MAGMGYAVMGTAVRSGDNRAIAAAQAAMASPLLEAGAIDGARGILINISGSSSLRLSEVNVASTLIQNAAHEDANIIFGAVLDESMGDEVKITVIATGFKHDQVGRHKRSASDALMPRVSVQGQPSVPRFASEEAVEEELSPLFQSRKATPQPPHGERPVIKEASREATREASPEPAPFTLAPQPVMIEEVHQVEQPAPPPMASAVHINFDEPFEEEYARLIPSKPDTARGMESAHRNEADAQLENLDIPAFLRRPVN